MPTVWFVPTNGELGEAGPGDYLLTPVTEDGDVLVGPVLESSRQGPQWFGRLPGAAVSASLHSRGDAATAPEDQQSLLRAVEDLRAERGGHDLKRPGSAAKA